jgi:tetratricopeptide (TPR) repeat protein
MDVAVTEVAKLNAASDQVFSETVDYGDIFGAHEAVYALPPRIRRERDPYRRIGLRCRLAHCAYMLMNHDTAIHQAKVGLRALARVTDTPTAAEAWLRTTLGTSYSRLGHSEDAVRELQSGAELYATVGDAESETEALAELAEALVDLDDDERASTILARCLPRLRGPWARDAAEQVATIARRRGDLDAEVDALELARREGMGYGSESYDHHTALTASTTELVHVLIERKADGDRDRAIELLEDSLEQLPEISGTDADDLRPLRRLLREVSIRRW